MASDITTRIAPPPRRVPAALRGALLANLPVLFGGGVLAVGLLLSIIFLSSGNLFGDLRLRLAARDAEGVLIGVEPTQFTSGGGRSDRRGSPSEWERRRIDEHYRIHRLDYSFELPDGTVVRGGSYVKGLLRARRIEQRAGDERRVTVEYVPSAPHTSRVQGTRTSPFGPGVLLVLIAPAIGLAIVAAGAVPAVRKVRLLRDGEAARATITGCRVHGPSGHDVDVRGEAMPFEQFRAEMRKTLADHIEEGTGTRTSGFSLSVMGVPIAGSRKVEEISGAEFKEGFRSHMKLFRRLLCGLFAFWGLIFAFILFAITQAEADAFERAMFLGVFVLFACGFAAFGWFVWKWTARAQGAVSGDVPMKMEDLRVRAECRFEFTTRDGRLIQAEDRVVFDSTRLGDEPHEPVLYDPADPKRALLLDGLPVAVRVGPTGDLEAAGTTARLLRLAAVGLALTAAVAAGSLAAGMSK